MLKLRISLFTLLFFTVFIGHTQSVSINQSNITFKIGANGNPIRRSGNIAIIKSSNANATGTIDISFDSFFYSEITFAELGIFEDRQGNPLVKHHVYSNVGHTLTQLSFGLATNKKYIFSLFFKYKLDGNLYTLEREIKLQFEADPVRAFAGADQTINCNGSTRIGGTPAATGGYSNYSYSWTASTGESVNNIARPAVRPTRNTTYTLKVTDIQSGQTDTDQMVVNVNAPAPPTPTITGLSRWGKCNTTKQVYQIDFNSNVANYEWSTSYGYITRYYYTNGKKTGVQISATNINLPIAQPIASSKPANQRISVPDNLFGGFTVTCKAISACGTTATTTKYIEFYYPLCGIFPRDLLSVNKNQQLKVSPNPVSIQQNKLSIAFDNKQHHNVWVEVYDMQGIKVLNFEDKSKEAFNKDIDVNALKLKPGLYIVRVSNGSETFQKRLFVQK